jgi:hypothetical protein
VLILKAMSDEPQIVSAVTAADDERLARQRQVVAKYVADESRGNFETAAGKLGTIRALLHAKVFAGAQTHELQSLGVVFGDALALELEMEWVIVEDAAGRDPALRAPGTSILVYPLTLISKRVERSEAVDVFDLFNAIADDVERLRREGR